MTKHASVAGMRRLPPVGSDTEVSIEAPSSLSATTVLEKGANIVFVQNQTSSSVVRTPRQFMVRMGRVAGQRVEWCPAEHGVLDSSAAEEYVGEAHQIAREWRAGFALNLRVAPLSELAT